VGERFSLADALDVLGAFELSPKDSLSSHRGPAARTAIRRGKGDAKKSPQAIENNGGCCRDRTYDPLIKRQRASGALNPTCVPALPHN
jgi:hypothetical protein